MNELSMNIVPGELEQARKELQTVLGLEREVPAAVARRAMLDAVYRHRLLVSRSSRPLLDHILADPGNERFAPPAAPRAVEKTSGELAMKAAGALAGWVKSGFALASPETVAKRLDACNACPHLTAPGKQLAYRLVPGGGERKSVCDLCGCVVRNKAKLPNETCPDADPDRPDRSRWGDPRRAG